MEPTTNNKKSDVIALAKFLNDAAWMELYGYTTFSLGEVGKLHEHLQNNNKGNLHREALVKEALQLFPHRTRKNGANKKLLGSIAIGIILLVASGAGALMIWG